MSRAYTYCANCNHGLPKATAREVTSGQQQCPSCGVFRLPNIDRDELVVDLADRIDELEERLVRLEPK